jgi:hypothetical protein
VTASLIFERTDGQTDHSTIVNKHLAQSPNPGWREDESGSVIKKIWSVRVSFCLGKKKSYDLGVSWTAIRWVPMLTERIKVAPDSAF